MSLTRTRLKRLEQSRQQAADAEAERFLASLGSLSDAELNLALQAACRAELRTQGAAWVRGEMQDYTPEYVEWLLHGEETEEAAAVWDAHNCFAHA